MRFIILIILFISFELSAQFTGGTFNNLMNMGDRNSLQFVAGKKLSKEDKMVDDIFSGAFKSLGVDTKTNETDIVNLSFFQHNNNFTWTFEQLSGNNYIIKSALNQNMVLGVENGSMNDNAAVIPMQYVQGAEHQIFLMERDSVNFRFGFYLIAKHSGKVIAGTKEKKVVQAAKEYGNAYHVWAISLRYQLGTGNDNEFIGVDKGLSLIPNAVNKLTASDITTNLDLINHPTGQSIYYIRNSYTSYFSAVKNDETGNPALGGQLYQTSYKTGVANSNMLYTFQKGENGKLKFLCYPDNTKAIAVKDGNIVVIPADDPEAYSWILYDPRFSIF